jgi:hypothetical protein
LLLVASIARTLAPLGLASPHDAVQPICRYAVLCSMLHITDVGGTILNTTFVPEGSDCSRPSHSAQKSLAALKLLGKY